MAKKNNKQLTKKEIDHYFELWGHIMTREKIISWGRQRLENFEDEWFGRGDYALPSNMQDCPGCWNVKERCTCNGAPKVETRGQKETRRLMSRTVGNTLSK